MNEIYKILSKRIELASNAMSASLFSGAALLLFKDGEILYKNSTFATVLILLGTSLYIGTTLLLMNLAKKGVIKSEDEETDDG